MKTKRKRSPRKPSQLDRIEAVAKAASADAGLAHAAVIAMQETVARIESRLTTLIDPFTEIDPQP